MIPKDLKYTKDHEWARLEGDVIAVGITYHAQEELTDVVFVELPEVGTDVAQGETVVVVESVKAASDTYAPAGGQIIAANDALDAEPGLVNTDPYGDGWIYKIKLSDTSELDSLMDAADYEDFVG